MSVLLNKWILNRIDQMEMKYNKANKLTVWNNWKMKRESIHSYNIPNSAENSITHQQSTNQSIYLILQIQYYSLVETVGSNEVKSELLSNSVVSKTQISQSNFSVPVKFPFDQCIFIPDDVNSNTPSSRVNCIVPSM